MAKYSKLKRVYEKSALSTGRTIEIHGENYRYLKTVVRLRSGDPFRIFNEQDGEYLAKILQIKDMHLICQVVELLRAVSNAPKLTLGLSIIKPTNFLEAIRGAVQIGVTHIVPLIAHNTQRAELNSQRIEKCILSASEQSERLEIPIFTAPMSIENLISEQFSKIIFLDEEAGQNSEELINLGANPIVVIGPEGGFTVAERALIMEHPKTVRMSLGTNVLRTEIATIAALSIVHYHRCKTKIDE